MHREDNAFALRINFQDGDFHFLLKLNYIGGSFNKMVGQFADMYQPILMYSDIHKSAEVGDIGDNSGEFHSRFQLVDTVDSGGEVKNFKLFRGDLAPVY